MEKVNAMKKIALFLMIVGLAVAMVACQGAVGKAGDGGATGPTGPTGPPGRDATPNTPPALKADKTLGTQWLAFAGRPGSDANTTGIQKVSVIPISTYFEDPEGVASLTYSLADRSADDKKVVTVYLTDELGKPGIAIGNDMFAAPNAMPTDMKDGVTGTAFLAIEAVAPGTVTLELTVNDGLPGGKSTHQIPVMVRAANGRPTFVDTVLDMAAFTAMSRIGVNRLASTETVTVTVPDGAFSDPDNDDLKVTATIGGSGVVAIAANKLLLDVSIDANGDLVLTSKKGGPPGNATIPVILTATDPFGTSIPTSAAAATDATASIQVKVNTPPMHQVYNTNDIIPTGKKAGDPRELSDIVDKDLSVSVEGTEMGDVDFIVLARYFMDADTAEDPIATAEGICSFATDQPAGDAAYATVTFGAQRANIGVKPVKPGSFVLSVTCTDNKMESLTDQVTVTIRQ